MRLNRSAVLQYGIAVGAVALAVVVRLLLDPLLNERLPFATLFAAVTFVAWHSGRGPALFALVSGVVSIAFFITEPRFSLGIEHREDIAGLVFYVVISAGCIELFDQLRSARSKAEDSAAEAHRDYQQFQRQSQLRQEAEAIAVQEGEQFRVTLASIGDGVITTDVNGNVTFLNEVARQLTGWTQQEAQGVPLEDVFHIVNETTRKPVGNPARRALREGRIVGLANHTLLIAKDGSERPVDDSAAPVRDEHGDVFGSVLTFRDVTEQRRAERTLRESDARKSAILEVALDCIITMDHDGRVVEFNPAAERTFGYTSAEIVGGELAHFIIPPSLRERHRRGMAHYLATGEGPVLGTRLELPAMRADGSEFPIELAITRIPVAGPPLFTAYLRDISERRKAEDEVKQGQEKLELLADTIPQLAWMARPDGHIFWYNRRWYEYTGTTPAEMEGWGWQSVHDPVELPGVLERWRGSIASGDPFEMVFPIKGADGQFRAFLTRVSPLRDDHGRVVYWFGTNTDIDDQQRTQDALRESEARFRQLADAMPQIVWTARADGRIDYQNRQWREFTGLPESVGNDGWEQILHPVDGPLAHERWATSLKKGAPFEMELRLLDRRTQAYRWHLIRTEVIHDDAGRVARWFGTSTDIHEQKRAEESSRYLAEASAALAGVVDYESTLQKVANLAVPYFADWSAVDIANDDGTLRRLAVAHQDPDRVALVQRLMQEYPPDPDSPDGVPAVVRTGTPQIVSDIPDEMLVHAARDEHHLTLLRSLGLKSFICVPLVVSGRTLGALTFATAESGRSYADADLALAIDLARRASIAVENTQLYQALRDSDRRKDEFLATLAHELRNPLAPIHNSLQILKMPRIDAETVERLREIMERQVHHLVRLVDDLLDVSRVTRGQIQLRKEQVEVATVVARAMETVQPLVDAQRHELSVQLPDDSLPIDADPVRLSQVIGNILTNASKYTEPGGRIWLTAAREGASAVLRIRDTGIGIAPDMLPRIFELFAQVDHASTRTQGGLGIGLTLAKNLVELHHGTIEARSDGLGTGSEFVVRLPISLKGLQNRGPREEGSAHPAAPSGLRLLVVDDNHDAALSLDMLLRLQGHEVRVAHNGMAALEMSRAYAPHAVFIDLGMPGMDGFEVAHRMRQQPGLEHVVLVAVTGWGQQDDRRRTANAGFNHHLVKPPEPAALEHVLAGLRQQLG